MDVASLNVHFTVRRTIKASEKMKQRAFARSTRTHDRNELSPRNREINLLQSCDRLLASRIGFLKVPNLDDILLLTIHIQLPPRSQVALPALLDTRPPLELPKDPGQKSS